MSLQASLNIAVTANNVKPSGNANSLPDANGISQENQLFSLILDSVGGGDIESTLLPVTDLVEGLADFVGPVLPDTGNTGVLSEASFSELQGNLLPLLSSIDASVSQNPESDVLGLDITSLNQVSSQINLDENVESSSALPLLAGSNNILENLRNLLAGANTEDDSNEVRELRTQLLSFLDNRQVNTSNSSEQALRNPALNLQSQVNLRQELDTTLGNIRGTLSDFFDRVERARSNDFFDLDRAIFSGEQRKPAGLNELLATLTKTNSTETLANTQPAQNPILTQITNLISGNAAITQPVFGVVADTGSLLPSNPTQTQVSAPLNSPQWSEELGQRVRWLVGQNLGSAQIRLNPAELGPVELRVNVSGDQVSVAFNSQFGVVREAIEAALPKLREMLESQGLNLAEADINDSDTADNQNSQETNFDNGAGLASNNSLDGEDPTVTNVEANLVELSSSNLVDQFV